MNIAMCLMSVVGGENICRGAGDVMPAGATWGQSSSYASSLDAANGFKYARSANGLWHSNYQNGPWWAWIDFGAGNEKTVREISIKPTNTLPNDRSPFEFYLQTSPDGVTWTDVLHVNNIPAWTLNVEKAWTVGPAADDPPYDHLDALTARVSGVNALWAAEHGGCIVAAYHTGAFAGVVQVATFDGSTLARLKTLALAASGNVCHGMVAIGGVAYVAHSAPGGHMVSRVTFSLIDPLNTYTHRYAAPGLIRSICVGHGSIWVVVDSGIVRLSAADLTVEAYVDGGASLSAYGVAADGQYVYALCTTEVKRIDPATASTLDVIHSGYNNGDYARIAAHAGRVFIAGNVGLKSFNADGTSILASPLIATHLSVTFGGGRIAFGGGNLPSSVGYLFDAATLDLLDTVTHAHGVRGFSLLSDTRAIAVYLGAPSGGPTPEDGANETTTGRLWAVT